MTDSVHDATQRPGTTDPLKSERIGRRLTETELDVRLSALPGWEVVDGGRALRRTFELPSFRAAMTFVAYVVEIAEAMDHRPGVELEDDTVTLTLTTHTAGGLTERDFSLAARIRC